MNAEKRWVLLDAQGNTFLSEQPGTLGGHRGSRIYGRLDCPAALRAIARGGYVRQRVFFADEASARSAGYRPCARCLPRAYAAWRAPSEPILAAIKPSDILARPCINTATNAVGQNGIPKNKSRSTPS
ncbi:Ada metal-binding domain-containing protein [Pseudomonas sp. 22526]|uniref:Ada metal-binding domain-containing protein n=1 Tax=Pseudomonas sp. 22526 TaxID=3453937 RepID=UPI003F841F52